MEPSATMPPRHEDKRQRPHSSPYPYSTLPAVPEDGILDTTTKPAHPPQPKKLVIRSKSTAIAKTAWDPATRRLVQELRTAETCRIVTAMLRHNNTKYTADRVAYFIPDLDVSRSITSTTTYEELYQSLLWALQAWIEGALLEFDVSGTISLIFEGKDHTISKENWVMESENVFGIQDAEFRFDYSISKKAGREGPEPTQGLMTRICRKVGTKTINTILKISLCGSEVCHETEDDDETQEIVRQLELTDDYARSYCTFPSRGRYASDSII